MKQANKQISFILSVYKEKCPKCNNGYVFKQNVSILNLPVMNECCSNCNYQFDRDPGYFLGAMYISYGLAVVQGVVTFFFIHFSFPLLSTFYEILSVIFVIIILGRKNYKLSRVLYIHIFPW